MLIEKFEVRHGGIDQYHFSIEIRQTERGEQKILMNFSIPDAHHDVTLSIEEFDEMKVGIEKIDLKINRNGT